MKQHTQRWSPDNRWVVLIVAEPTWADFKLVEVAGVEGGTDVSLFQLPNPTPGLSPFTTHPENAEVIAEGFVKWDGCTEATIAQHHMCDAAESVLDLGRRWAWALNECHAAMLKLAVEEGKDPLNALEWDPVDLEQHLEQAETGSETPAKT